MKRERLEEAVELRTADRADEARALLLELASAYPEDAEIAYQTAWTHDRLGREREAVPWYVRALALGLSGADRAGALLGLGSTYRTLGEYRKSEATLRQGMREFPDDRAFPVFLAMALHNLRQHDEAMQLLLTSLAETSADESILRYRRAILFYAPQLDRTWEQE